jgi:hypothetical protein
MPKTGTRSSCLKFGGLYSCLRMPSMGLTGGRLSTVS